MGPPRTTKKTIAGMYGRKRRNVDGNKCQREGVRRPRAQTSREWGGKNDRIPRAVTSRDVYLFCFAVAFFRRRQRQPRRRFLRTDYDDIYIYIYIRYNILYTLIITRPISFQRTTTTATSTPDGISFSRRIRFFFTTTDYIFGRPLIYDVYGVQYTWWRLDDFMRRAEHVFFYIYIYVYTHYFYYYTRANTIIIR